MLELRAHRASYDFRVPHIDGASQRNRRRCAEGGSGSDDRPDIARVLYGVEQYQAAHGADFQCIKGAARNLGDGEDALRRLGFGGGAEVFLIQLQRLDARCSERVAKRLTARRVGKLWRDEDAADSQSSAQELLDSADALGDKQRVFLASLSASQVARKSEKFQVVVSITLAGMGLASASLGISSLEHQ